MSKHTRGEWVAIGTWVELADDDEHGIRPDICVCDPANFGQENLKRSQEETMANARLIALAPAMYDYLKLLSSRGDETAAAIISNLD